MQNKIKKKGFSMGKVKQQMLNFQAQLDHIGLCLERFSKLSFNVNQFDDIGTEFKSVMEDIDLQQTCARYVWKGLPDYLQSYQIELMLFYKAGLVGYIIGGILYLLPFTMNKGLNVYGQANGVQAISFNGILPGESQRLELITNDIGGVNKGAKGAILYDRIPVWNASTPPIARCALHKELIDFQCNLLGRIKNNLKNCDKKAVFWVDNEKQANQAKEDLRQAYGTNDPFIVMVRGSAMSDKQQDTLQGDIANQTQALFEAWQSANSIRCMASGIKNSGAFEKKERKITGELQGDETQTNLILDMGLKMRKLWIEQMKIIYPDYSDMLNKITVEINEKAQQEDVSFDENMTANENGGESDE